MSFEYHGNPGDVSLKHESKFVFVDHEDEQVSVVSAGQTYWRDDLDHDPWYKMTDSRSFRDLWTNETADSVCDTAGVLKHRGIDPSVLDMEWHEAQEELEPEMLLDVLVTRHIGLITYYGIEREEYYDDREVLVDELVATGVPEDEIR